MASEDKITLEGEHGQYQTTVYRLSMMIRKYLPVAEEDLAELQQEIIDRQGDPEYRVGTLAEALMILAELDGFATN